MRVMTWSVVAELRCGDSSKDGFPNEQFDFELICHCVLPLNTRESGRRRQQFPNLCGLPGSYRQRVSSGTSFSMNRRNSNQCSNPYLFLYLSKIISGRAEPIHQTCNWQFATTDIKAQLHSEIHIRASMNAANCSP